MKAFYDDYAVETFENYDRRMEEIQELIDFTARFESVEQFLSELALLTNVDRRRTIRKRRAGTPFV